MDKKISISGASGFVGQNLVRHIEDNRIGRTVKLDLRKKLPKSLGDVSAVIHLAGKAHDLRKNVDANEYFQVNTELTKALFDLFLLSDAKDFIYFSSVKAVADSAEGILTEDTQPNPFTPYGKSKLKAEEYLLKSKLPAGKRLFILRPCMIHGPGNKGNLNLLYRVVAKGFPYPLAAFDNRRSFLSVSNLCFVVERLLSDSLVQGGIYNVADDEPLSTNEVIKVISSSIGRKPKLWRINVGLVKSLAQLGDKLHLPLNTERLTKLTESYVVSNTRLKAALNIITLPTSSKDGLSITVKSFREQ